jgi:hypothetical protein
MVSESVDIPGLVGTVGPVVESELSGANVVACDSGRSSTSVLVSGSVSGDSGLSRDDVEEVTGLV